jgi:hypothetical protein
LKEKPGALERVEWLFKQVKTLTTYRNAAIHISPKTPRRPRCSISNGLLVTGRLDSMCATWRPHGKCGRAISQRPTKKGPSNWLTRREAPTKTGAPEPNSGLKCPAEAPCCFSLPIYTRPSEPERSAACAPSSIIRRKRASRAPTPWGGCVRCKVASRSYSRPLPGSFPVAPRSRRHGCAPAADIALFGWKPV